ncbi:MAG: hypothetical protein M1814_001084 [Vezdaea aestivalis]|nr:MAG: hypothetical protein M1814_001084 [Vezdaea aestivalis]
MACDFIDNTDSNPMSIDLSREELKCYQALCTSNYEQHKARNPERSLGTDDNKEQENALEAVSAILHQLLTTNKQLIKSHLLPVFQAKNLAFSKEMTSLWNILTDATADVTAGDTICILDGLDECEEVSRTELMKVLAKLDTHPRNPRLKFLVTGRPYMSIEDGLEHPSTIRLRAEDESDATAKDVKSVIGAKIHHFAQRRKLSAKAEQRILDTFNKNVEQTFLWASLVLSDLESSLLVSEERMDGLISQIPETLDAAYENILDKSGATQDTRKALHIILGAGRPLSLQEMNLAFVIRSEDRDYDNLALEPDIKHTIRNLCGLIVKVIDSKFFLIHQTARTFLIKTSDCKQPRLGTWKNSFDPGESQLVLTKSCTYFLTGWDDGTPDFLFRGHYFCNYAAHYWIAHFREAQFRVDDNLLASILSCIRTPTVRSLTWDGLGTSKNYTELIAYGMTPLASASCAGFKVIAKIREKWRNGTYVCNFFRTKGTAKLLLERGADIEAKDNDGRTALIKAAEKGWTDLAQLLLDKGANIKAYDKTGKTTLLHAATGPDWPSPSDLEFLVVLLLEEGAEIEAQDNDGCTALIRTVENGWVELTQLLLDKGAKLRAHDKTGRTALSIAAGKRDGEILSILRKELVRIMHTRQS